MLKKIIVLALLSPLAAHAVPISVSGNDFDDQGGSTIDLQTNLEWLDMDTTAGRSQCSVAADIGEPLAQCLSTDAVDQFDDAAGWRYATRAEVVGLFSNWFNVVLDATELFDAAGTTPALNQLFLDVFAGGANSIRPDIARYDVNPFQARGIQVTATGVAFGVFNGSIQGSCCDQGSVLVRDANRPPVSVPEPSTLALLLAGFLGVAATRRRRTENS